MTKTARIKLTDKRAALVDLGKHLGLFEPKKPRGSGENPIEVLMRHAQATTLPVVAKPPPDDEDDEDDPQAA